MTPAFDIIAHFGFVLPNLQSLIVAGEMLIYKWNGFGLLYAPQVLEPRIAAT
jgi:hypothetical protein